MVLVCTKHRHVLLHRSVRVSDVQAQATVSDVAPTTPASQMAQCQLLPGAKGRLRLICAAFISLARRINQNLAVSY